MTREERKKLQAALHVVRRRAVTRKERSDNAFDREQDDDLVTIAMAVAEMLDEGP